MTRRRDSDRPPPAHPADALDAFTGGSGIEPYQGADGMLERDRWADDDELDEEDDEPRSDRDASADAVAAELRLGVLREKGPLRWTPTCPAAFPCNVPEGEGSGECRYRLPLEPVLGCALALAEAGPRTLDAVGEALGVCRQRAWQLEARALGKVRAALEVLDGRAFDDPDERGFDDDDLDDGETELDDDHELELDQGDDDDLDDDTARPSPEPTPGKVDARASVAKLRGILTRHGAISRAAPAMAHGPPAMSSAAELRELGRLTRQLHAATRARGAR